MKNTAKFFYKLFFTRDDDLDMLQILFTAIIIHSLMTVWVIVNGAEQDAVKIEALVTLRWLAGLLVLTAVPKWLVPAMKQVTLKKQEQISAQSIQTSETNAEETN